IMPITVVTTGMVTMLPSGAPLSEIVPSLISVALTPTSVAPPLPPAGALPVPLTTLPPPPPGAGVAGGDGVPGCGVPGAPEAGADGAAEAADLDAGAFDFAAADAAEEAGAAAVAPPLGA